MSAIRTIYAKTIRPMQSKSAAYTFVLGDQNETFLHPAADTTARTFTIPANSSVAYATGTTLRIINEVAAGVVTLTITTDTLFDQDTMAAANILIQPGEELIVTKVSSTAWIGKFVGKRHEAIISKSAAYGFVAGDAGKAFLHPAADTTARTWTIPANSSVAFPLGSVLKIFNETSAGVITVAITTDTLLLMPTGTTSTVAIAASGYAVITKITSTKWGIYGGGLT